MLISTRYHLVLSNVSQVYVVENYNIIQFHLKIIVISTFCFKLCAMFGGRFFTPIKTWSKSLFWTRSLGIESKGQTNLINSCKSMIIQKRNPLSGLISFIWGNFVSSLYIYEGVKHIDRQNNIQNYESGM